MGVCTSIAEITVTRYTLISVRGLHLQWVGYKVWLSSDCVWLFQSFSWTGCLSRVTIVPVWLCTLFICYWCCIVIRYSHELAGEELLSLDVWAVISLCMYLVWQERENHFWDLRVMAPTFLGWTLKTEAVCFVWNVGNCLLNCTILSCPRRPSLSVRTWNLTRLKVLIFSVGHKEVFH